MLALICGTGTLPSQVALAQTEKPLVCILEGFEPDYLGADLSFRLETLGSLLIQLRQHGVTDVCLCGAIDRPGFDPSKLDEHTAPFIPLIAGALTSGDDGALRTVMGLFEQTGFTVRAAHELVPDLIAPPGILSEKWPDAQMREDARLGASVLAALAPMDVGQACVTGGGQLIGMETIGGTNFMLSHLPDTVLRAQGVLVKGPKLGQDIRADMPTIGPETITNVVNSGLSGIVINAGDVIFLEPEKCIAMANAAGLVLWSRTGE